jgi:hypothetical protein
MNGYTTANVGELAEITEGTEERQALWAQRLYWNDLLNSRGDVSKFEEVTNWV